MFLLGYGPRLAPGMRKSARQEFLKFYKMSNTRSLFNNGVLTRTGTGAQGYSQGYGQGQTDGGDLRAMTKPHPNAI